MYLQDINLFNCVCDSADCQYSNNKSNLNQFNNNNNINNNNNNNNIKMKSEKIINTDINSNRAATPKKPYGKTMTTNNIAQSEPEVRNEAVLALRNKFPNKIPIILKRFYREANLPHLEKSKYLVPQEITMSQFQTIIRNRMRMGPNQALYLLINDRSMLSLSLTLAEVYSTYADPDGFLYITYASQEVFGGKKK